MQFADSTEMVAINRKGNGQWEQLGTTEKRPEQELPIVDALLAHDTQVVDGTEERQDVLKDVLKVQRGFNLWRLVLSQEGLDALIVVLG